MRRKANAAYVRKDPQRWKDLGWTSGPNMMIRDPDLPLELVGAWMWLASNTEEFEVSGRVLWESKNDLGRNRAFGLLSELEKRGYLLRNREFDPVAGVPFIQYELQPWPVPEEERTWEPPRAATKAKRPHPGSKAAREAETAGQDGFPTGRERAGQKGFPTGRESAATRTVPTGRDSGVESQGVGSRQAGTPYKEEKITPKEHPPFPPGVVTKAVDQEDEEEIAEETHRTARQLVAGLRFRADRFLMPQAKQQVTGLVAQRLRDGWPPEFLGRKLGEWAEQAGNPSTYLPVQLDQLGAPRPRPQVVPDEKPAPPPPANEDTRAAVMAQLRAQGRPARPVSRKAVTTPDDGKPGPERALASLDALLGELKGARNSS